MPRWFYRASRGAAATGASQAILQAPPKTTDQVAKSTPQGAKNILAGAKNAVLAARRAAGLNLPRSMTPNKWWHKFSAPDTERPSPIPQGPPPSVWKRSGINKRTMLVLWTGRKPMIIAMGLLTGTSTAAKAKGA